MRMRKNLLTDGRSGGILMRLRGGFMRKKYFTKLLLLLLLAAGHPGLHAEEGEKMENKRVLISGAGVAGLTMAYWLKAYGFEPTHVEKHPELRAGGYKIDIRGVALDIIERMEVYPSLVEARTDIQGAALMDSSARSKEIDVDLCGGRVQGDLEIMRGDLCQILWKSLKEIDYLFGDSIKKISESAAGVVVEFEKSDPQIFDLVIGADGLHSNVRQQVFGEESQFLKELGFYISVYSIPNFLNLDRREIEYFEPQKFVNVYSLKGNLEAKAGFAFSSTLQKMDKQSVEVQQKFLKEVFEGVEWEVPRLLSFMEEASDFYFDVAAQIQMASWSHGRVALVGDAGYAPSPLSGQGTSVAMVGAYLLAGELAKARGDYRVAFSAYEKELRKFVTKNQELVKLNQALMGAENGWVSERVMQILPIGVIEFFKAWGAKRINKAANYLQLKDYPGESG